MRFVGVDLAWGVVNETGVVALDQDGSIAAAGWTLGVEATARWIEEHALSDTVAFIDAPLLVLNDTGQRICEKQAGQRYGRWKVSANSTNKRSPRRAGVDLRERLEQAGWRYDDGTSGPPTSGRVFSECYPYTTLVGATELGYDQERPRYKRKPRGTSVAEWRPNRAAACDELIERLDILASATPSMQLRTNHVTERLLDESSPLDDRAYKHREDLIDACLAAWTAALWTVHGQARCQVLGSDDPLDDSRGARATIIAPARDDQRR